MGKRDVAGVWEQLRSIALRGPVEVRDGQLLERFITQRDETALEILVQRHGPMILSLCQRVLGNRHDAEDAFQATFLVLVRKASSIYPRDMVGSWLYGVAYNTALKGRAMAARRKARETSLNGRPEPADGKTRENAHDLEALDQELHRLPAIHRAAVILCELEGKTIKEAAHQLGLAEGTMASRLSRARELLGKRLKRRGIVLGLGGVGVMLAGDATAAIPASLIAATVRATAQFAAGQMGSDLSAEAVGLANAVLKSMLLARLKSVAIIFLGLMLPLSAYLAWAVLGGQAATTAEKIEPVHVPIVGNHAEKPQRHVDVDVGDGILLKMVRIEPGSFKMGSALTVQRRLANQGPEHEVEISRTFCIGVYEVTQQEYQKVMGDNPSEIKAERFPVENVSWDDAIAFCGKLSEKTGKNFDLPTEAEWEFACRAGTTGNHHCGENLSRAEAQFAAGAVHPRTPVAVGSFAPNAWGIFDMHGNVGEWVKDWYQENYDKHGLVRDPSGPAAGSQRVVRGGGYLSGDMNCRSASRVGRRPDLFMSATGFRVVLRLP